MKLRTNSIFQSDPDYSPRESKNMIKNRKNIFNSSIWSDKQEILYAEFIQTNIESFKNTDQRKKNKVFILMSSNIKSRNRNQCRSHHQKMCKKYGSINNIIQKIKQKVKDKNEETCLQTPRKTHIKRRNSKIQKYIQADVQQVSEEQSIQIFKQQISFSLSKQKQSQNNLWKLLDQNEFQWFNQFD